MSDYALGSGLWRSLVSALDWGSRGREFKSPQPDHRDLQMCGVGGSWLPLFGWLGVDTEPNDVRPVLDVLEVNQPLILVGRVHYEVLEVPELDRYEACPGVASG